MILRKRRRVVLLTTTVGGVNLAKGVCRAGHRLVAVGRGVASAERPIGAISRDELAAMLSTEVKAVDIDFDSPNEVAVFLRDIEHDVTLMVWPRILSEAVLEAGSSFYVGTHPTPLPLGRGRHPLHWMRVLGLRRSWISAFRVDAGIDSGRIVASVPFRTLPWRDIRSDIDRLESKMTQLGFILGLKLLLGYPNGFAQAHERRTVWPKRTQIDSAIDFRMSSRGIVQHVRSLAHPFPLASASIGGIPHRVAQARVAPFALLNRRTRWSVFGQVIKDLGGEGSSRRVLVRCFGGAVWLSVDRDGYAA